jgi:hypothetical protein
MTLEGYELMKLMNRPYTAMNGASAVCKFPARFRELGTPRVYHWRCA